MLYESVRPSVVRLTLEFYFQSTKTTSILSQYLVYKYTHWKLVFRRRIIVNILQYLYVSAARHTEIVNNIIIFWLCYFFRTPAASRVFSLMVEAQRRSPHILVHMHLVCAFLVDTDAQQLYNILSDIFHLIP